MKLTKKQREALEWLSKEGPWTTAWWGGRPHTRWPKELPAATHYALLNAGLVRTRAGKWADRSVEITQRGRAALTPDQP